MSKIDFRMGIAAKIAKELDKKDGKEDNKISKDIWNDFVEDKNGKCIRGYITIFNAVKSINYYMKKNVTQNDLNYEDVGKKWLEDILSLSKTSQPEPVEPKDSKIEMKLSTNIKQEEAVSTRVQKQIVETELIAESKKDDISLEKPKFNTVALKNKMSPVKASNNDIDLKTLDLAFDNVINELLKKSNQNKSALLGRAEAFMQSAKDKEIDVFTLMGVAMIESAYGTSSMALNKNNVGGLMGPKGGIRYRNVSDSINVSARVMHRNIYDKGLTNIHSVGMKGNYCCANASLRNTWVNNVTKFANQIRNEYNQLLQGETA